MTLTIHQTEVPNFQNCFEGYLHSNASGDLTRHLSFVKDTYPNSALNSASESCIEKYALKK